MRKKTLRQNFFSIFFSPFVPAVWPAINGRQSLSSKGGKLITMRSKYNYFLTNMVFFFLFITNYNF